MSLSEYVKEMAECMKKEREEIPVKWRREYNQLQQDRSKVTTMSPQGHNKVATM